VAIFLECWGLGREVGVTLITILLLLLLLLALGVLHVWGWASMLRGFPLFLVMGSPLKQITFESTEVLEQTIGYILYHKV